MQDNIILCLFSFHFFILGDENESRTGLLSYVWVYRIYIYIYRVVCKALRQKGSRKEGFESRTNRERGTCVACTRECEVQVFFAHGGSGIDSLTSELVSALFICPTKMSVVLFHPKQFARSKLQNYVFWNAFAYFSFLYILARNCLLFWLLMLICLG